jgi:hypothetical protein
MHPGFLAAKAPIVIWARECHIRTSPAAQPKGQDDVLTIGELRQVGDLVMSAMKKGSKVILWGPAEALGNSLELMGLGMRNYHTLIVLRTMEECDLFVGSPAMLADLLAIEFRWKMHDKVSKWIDHK